MDEPSDRALVLRTRRGEVEAYGELVRRYQRAVYNVCYRLCGERREAEDLTQEALIRAYQRLDTFDVERPFRPWVQRVAANLCYNHLSKKRPVQVAIQEEHDPGWGWEHTPEAAQQTRERSEALRAAIQSLPPHYRVVIELRHFQNMSYAEIAEALDTSISQVKSHLFRARKLLSERYHPEDW